jgi:hypothetical protein
MASPLRLVNETPPNTFLVDVSSAFGDKQKMVNCFKADIGHDMGDQFTDNLRDDFKRYVSNFSDSVGKEMVLRYVGLQHNDLHKTSSKTENPSRIGTPDMDDGKKALRTILRRMSGPLLGTTFSGRGGWDDEQKRTFAKHILLLITAIHLDGDGNSINEILDIFFDAEVIPFAELYAFCRANVGSPLSLKFNVYYDEKNPITVARDIGFNLPPNPPIPIVRTRVLIDDRLLFQTHELSIDSTDTRFASSVTTLTTIARTYYTLVDPNLSSVIIQKVIKDNYVKRAGKTLGKVSPGMLDYITRTVNSALGQSTSKEDVLKGCCAIKTSCDSTKAVLTESLQAILTAFGKSDTAISFFTGDILAFSIFGYTLGGSGSTAISSYDPRPQDGSPSMLESFTLTRGEGGGQVVFNNVPLTGGASFTIDEGTIAEQGKDFGFTEGIVTGLLPPEGGAGSGDADMGSTVMDSNRMKLFSILKQLRLENRGNPIYKTDGTPNKIFYAWVIQLLKTANLTTLFGDDYLGALVKLMEFPFPIGDTYRSFADVPISIARTNIIETVLFTMALGLFEFHKISPPEDDTQKNTLDYITTLVYVYLYKVYFDKTITNKNFYLAPLKDTFNKIYGPDPFLGKVTLLSSDKYNQFYIAIGTKTPGAPGFGTIVEVATVGSSRRIKGITPLKIPPALPGKGILKFSNIATASSQGVLLMSVLGTDFNTISTKLKSIFPSTQLTTLY